MIRVWIVLLLALCASAAQGAGRVFYDGFENYTGTDPLITALWGQDNARPRCVSVTSAADGIAGPYAGSRMARCNTSVGDVFENLTVPAFSMTNEVLYRFKFRVDTNHDRTGGDPRGSPAKKLRLFYWTGNQSTYNDNYGVVDGASGGMRNEGLVDGTQWTTYDGGASGDHTQESSAWHTVELYWNKSNGNHKVWHDDVLVLNVTLGSIQGGVGEGGGDFYLMSNWEDTHDATNYTYFDEAEVYTDNGTGLASGTLANGDAVQGGVGGIAPTVTSVSCIPTLNQAPAATNCTASATGDTPITWAWTQEGTNCTWSNAAAQSPTLTCQYGGGRAPCARATNATGTHQLCMATNGVVWRYVKPSGFGAN